jgi:hypothetical protein
MVLAAVGWCVLNQMTDEPAAHCTSGSSILRATLLW